jgi:cobalt/nickel transport protein
LILILGFSIFIAVALSPFANSKPDGLDRVAEDLKFADKATSLKSPIPLADKLTNYQVQGVPSWLATPLAGLLGTVTTFAMTWTLGKLMIKKRPNPTASEELS